MVCTRKHAYVNNVPFGTLPMAILDDQRVHSETGRLILERRLCVFLSLQGILPPVPQNDGSIP